MEKKINILFVIESLACAGAEKSLLTLLSLIDYSKYSVALQLFSHNGELQSLLPHKVNLLPLPEYLEFTSLSLKSAFFKGLREKKVKYLLSRLKFSYILRRNGTDNVLRARLFWEINSSCINNLNKEYDIAIAYAQGTPTFFVVDKVVAKKKFAWINVSYNLKGIEKEYQREYYKIFDKIVLVSFTAKEVFSKVYPEYKEKLKVIYDINNPNIIEKMAKIGEKLPKTNKHLNLLTIGRFTWQKGYDLALDACKILKEKGIKFKWYVIGKGALRKEIEEKVRKMKLEENFIFLGVTSNPYGYIKSSDIYVQPSKHEGFGLAIAEARILNIPVVTTEFDAVYNQMVQRKNGIVTPMNGEGVANGILELIENKQLRYEIIEYLKNEKKGNLEEYDNFLKLLNS